MANHSEIARRWARWNAQGTGKSYWNSRSRVSYNDERFYSYHTVIARVVEHGGAKLVLMTSHGYSNSSQKHKHHAYRAACGAHLEVFHVPFLGAGGGWNMSDAYDHGTEVSRAVHDGNLSSMHASLQRAVTRAETQVLRDHAWPWRNWFDPIVSLCADAKRYMARFDLPEFMLDNGVQHGISLFDSGHWIAKAEGLRALRLERYNDPALTRRRERARARRLLRQAMEV
jgi:hypothetical protein